jgi:hypothetical protein
VRLDARPLPDVHVVGSWNDLGSLFEGRTFHVVVWDPPHQTDGGVGALGGRWADAYGTAGDGVRGHRNISHLYKPFLAAAREVLDPTTGLLLVKIADQVHAGETQLQSVALVVELWAAGWHVCAMIPKHRPSTGDDPKWKRQRHVRQGWSYWIAAHPGLRCTATGVDLYRKCEGCAEPFKARRKDQWCCNGTCRKRAQRRRTIEHSVVEQGESDACTGD